MSPLRSACNALWEPHPGQSYPVINFEGHFGKKPYTSGSKYL